MYPSHPGPAERSPSGDKRSLHPRLPHRPAHLLDSKPHMTRVTNKPEQYLTRAKIGRQAKPSKASQEREKLLEPKRTGYIDAAGYVHWNRAHKSRVR